MKRLIIIILILAFLVTDNLFAQKGMKVGNASQAMPDVIYRTGWAVVIGINKYPNVPQLEYADAVADLIKRKFRFEESNITVQ